MTNCRCLLASINSRKGFEQECASIETIPSPGMSVRQASVKLGLGTEKPIKRQGAKTKISVEMKRRRQEYNQGTSESSGFASA
jgi:hypothetical protein